MERKPCEHKPGHNNGQFYIAEPNVPPFVRLDVSVGGFQAAGVFSFWGEHS